MKWVRTATDDLTARHSLALCSSSVIYDGNAGGLVSCVKLSASNRKSGNVKTSVRSQAWTRHRGLRVLRSGVFVPSIPQMDTMSDTDDGVHLCSRAWTKRGPSFWAFEKVVEAAELLKA